MKNKFKVEYRKRLISKDYLGMNRQAAMELHIPFKHLHRTIIEVFKGQSPSMRRRTRVHEELEYNLMHKNIYPHPEGLPYRKAHRIALKYEKSKGNINTILNTIKKNEQTRNHLANRKRSI
jgi:hypothetical protein